MIAVKTKILLSPVDSSFIFYKPNLLLRGAKSPCNSYTYTPKEKRALVRAIIPCNTTVKNKQGLNANLPSPFLFMEY
jgi:hypothetical protein